MYPPQRIPGKVNQIASFGPPRRRRRNHKSKKTAPLLKRRTPSAAKFLLKPLKWQHQLDAGEIESQAAIARRESGEFGSLLKAMAG